MVCFGGELMLKHLALRMAMEAMVAIGACSLFGLVEGLKRVRLC